MKNKLKSFVAAALAVTGLTIQNNTFAADVVAATYHAAKVDGRSFSIVRLTILSRPTIVLRQGFPRGSFLRTASR